MIYRRTVNQSVSKKSQACQLGGCGSTKKYIGAASLPLCASLICLLRHGGLEERPVAGGHLPPRGGFGHRAARLLLHGHRRSLVAHDLDDGHRCQQEAGRGCSLDFCTGCGRDNRAAKQSTNSEGLRNQCDGGRRVRADAAACGDGGRDGDHDVGERGVGGAGVAAGLLPGELPRGAQHLALRQTHRGGGHGRGRVPSVPVPAPALPPPPPGRGRPRPFRRQELHDQGLPRPRLEQAPPPAPCPPPRLQPPLHGRGRGVVPGPEGAHHGGGGHHDVERLLLRRPGRPGQLPQHGVHLLQGHGEERARHGVLARGEGALSQGPRPVRLQRDQAGARGAADRRPDQVRGQRRRQRVLPAGARPEPDRHRAHDLLHRAGEQAARPEAHRGGLEAVRVAPGVGAASREDRVEVRWGQVHTLIIHKIGHRFTGMTIMERGFFVCELRATAWKLRSAMPLPFPHRDCSYFRIFYTTLYTRLIL